MKKMFFAALAATMMFASCNKEVDGVNGDSFEGESTGMGLTITLPSAAEGRATGSEGTTVNATTAESALNTIYVFIYKTDGTAATGNGTELNLTGDFDHVGGTTYELKAGSRIEATAGAKKIYIVANLPAGITAPASELALKAMIEDWDTVADSWNMGLGKFVMSSDLTSKTLVAEAYDVPVSANVVSVDLKRIMSKVTVTADAPGARFEQHFSLLPAFKIEYFISHFEVAQVAKSAYLIQNVDAVTGNLVTPNANRTGHLPSTVAVGGAFASVVGGTTGTVPDITNNTARYIGENYPESGKIKDATYVMIRTMIKPNQKAVATGSVITWESLAAGDFAGGTGSNLWTVRSLITGQVYFCASSADSDDVADALQSPAGGHSSGDIELVTYNACKAYFTVLINQDRTGKEGVIYRNQYIQLDIAGITNDIFNGMPGDPTDPTGDTPPDPQDPDNPDPWNPEDPIVEEPAGLHVNVTVAPWDYIPNSIMLK